MLKSESIALQPHPDNLEDAPGVKPREAVVGGAGEKPLCYGRILGRRRGSGNLQFSPE